MITESYETAPGDVPSRVEIQRRLKRSFSRHRRSSDESLKRRLDKRL
jgi:hypothetical protein